MRPVRPLLLATWRAPPRQPVGKPAEPCHRIPAIRLSWKCGLTAGLMTDPDKMIPGRRRGGAKSTCLQAREGHADAAAHRAIGPDHRRSPLPG